MRIVSILFSLLILTFTVFLSMPYSVRAETFLNQNNIVRGFVWGVSSKDVARFEKGKFLKSEGSNVFYSDTLYERASTIGYQFSQDRLIRARLDIHGRTPDPQDWITLLMDVQKDLNKKWGKPVSEDFFWRNEKEKDFPNNWGFAVLTSDLAIRTKWVAGDTQITVILDTVEKLTPTLTVLYEKIAQERNYTPKVDIDVEQDDVLIEEPDADIDDLLILP